MQKPANTLLRPYQKALVPDLPLPRDDKDINERIVRHLERGCKEYKHPGLYKFLYTQSCFGHNLRPLPEKPPLNKKKLKKKEEQLPLPEQMHLAYLETQKHKYDDLWERYLEYVEAMKLADHIVQQQQQDMFYIDSMPVKAPSFTISTTVRKMRTPKSQYLMRGRVI